VEASLWSFFLDTGERYLSTWLLKNSGMNSKSFAKTSASFYSFGDFKEGLKLGVRHCA